MREVNIFKLDLQFFAEEETEKETKVDGTETEEEKTFTQAELDKIVADRLKREKKALQKQVEDAEEKAKQLEKEKKFEKLNEEERKLAEAEDSKNELEKANEELRARLAELEKGNRRSEILEESVKDKIPCSDKFAEIVPFIAGIEDAEERSKIYMSLKNWASEITKGVKKDLYKNETSPQGGAGKTTSENNPFKGGNMTEKITLIRNNPDLAKELALEAGVYDKYKKHIGR